MSNQKDTQVSNESQNVANLAVNAAEPATTAEVFELSAEERDAIEHEKHHYEDARAASIEALKIVQNNAVGCRMGRFTLLLKCWVSQPVMLKVWRHSTARSSANRLGVM